MIKRRLCPRCETGKKTYELDRRSGECPYLGMHNGKSCPKFIEIKKEGLFKHTLKRCFYPPPEKWAIALFSGLLRHMLREAFVYGF